MKYNKIKGLKFGIKKQILLTFIFSFTGILAGIAQMAQPFSRELVTPAEAYLHTSVQRDFATRISNDDNIFFPPSDGDEMRPSLPIGDDVGFFLICAAIYVVFSQRKRIFNSLKKLPLRK